VRSLEFHNFCSSQNDIGDVTKVVVSNMGGMDICDERNVNSSLQKREYIDQGIIIKVG